MAASRWKRSKRMGSASMSGWGILRATVRLSREIGGAEDGGHAAARDGRVDAVGIELCSCLQDIVETHRAVRSIEALSTLSGTSRETVRIL